MECREATSKPNDVGTYSGWLFSARFSAVTSALLDYLSRSNGFVSKAPINVSLSDFFRSAKPLNLVSVCAPRFKKVIIAIHPQIAQGPGSLQSIQGVNPLLHCRLCARGWLNSPVRHLNSAPDKWRARPPRSGSSHCRHTAAGTGACYVPRPGCRDASRGRARPPATRRSATAKTCATVPLAAGRRYKPPPHI